MENKLDIMQSGTSRFQNKHYNISIAWQKAFFVVHVFILISSASVFLGCVYHAFFRYSHRSMNDERIIFAIVSIFPIIFFVLALLTIIYLSKYQRLQKDLFLTGNGELIANLSKYKMRFWVFNTLTLILVTAVVTLFSLLFFVAITRILR